MKDIQAISTLLNHHSPDGVVELSVLLHDIEYAIHTNTITQQEYVDLMQDVERLRQVISLANDLKVNQLIHDALVELVDLAKQIKL